MGITRELVEFCDAVKYENLPPEVVDRVKYHFLDFVGIASRGALVESSQAVHRFIKDIGLSSEGSVIIGTDMRAAPEYAALANGAAAHSLELDDLHNESSLHPAVAVFPAALAASAIDYAHCNHSPAVNVTGLAHIYHEALADQSAAVGGSAPSR